MSEQNKTAIEYLHRLSGEKFWGSVTVKFEAGRIVHVRREENLKPEELSRQVRLMDDRDAR
jgi:ribosomal protein L35AE/L33A